MMLRVVITTVLFALAASASAEIYKWADSGGHIHYSDKPPATQAEIIDIASRRTDPDRIAALSSQRRQADEERQTVIAAEADRQRLEQQQQQTRDKNCEIARKALASLLSATRVYEPLPDGGRRYLEQNEVDERMAAARADVDEWCKTSN